MAESPEKQPFVELFLRHQDDVYGFVATLLPFGDDAEEVFQRTSLILWEKHDEFDQTRDFCVWANGIARNVARNYLREKRRQGPVFSESVMDLLAESHARAASAIDDRLQFLSTCIDKLSDARQKLLQQCYGNEESIKSIAAEEGLSPAALYKRLDRTRMQLIECIEGELRKERR